MQGGAFFVVARARIALQNDKGNQAARNILNSRVVFIHPAGTCPNDT